MAKVCSCKLATFAFLLLSLGLVTAEILEKSEARTVPTIEFTSKTKPQETCIGYHVYGNLFVTKANCLGSDVSEINGVRGLEVMGLGYQDVDAFALQATGSGSPVDIAILTADPEILNLESVPEAFQKLMFGSVDRMRRESGNGNSSDPTATSAAGQCAARLLATVMAFVGLAARRR